MGRRHIHAARKLGLNITGVVDHSPVALQEVKNEHDLGSEIFFSTQESLYAEAVPDCLVISTTADSHCKLVCDAAAWGVKYLLVEKPMAVSLAECEMMMRACSKYGAKLAVNHQMRFMEQYTKPKTLLDSEAYGGFKSMTVVAGNCGVSMNGTHYFEAFRFMADEDPFEVTAWFSPDIVANPRGVQFEDRAGSVRVTTVSGKRLYLEIGADQGHGLQVTYAGRNGMISINEFTGEMVTSLRESQYRDLPTALYGMPADISHETITPAEVIDSTAEVLSALLSDHSNNVTAQQGMMAVRVLVAAYRSSTEGNIPIRLDRKLDFDLVFPWA